jgi:hypothetical protein
MGQHEIEEDRCLPLKCVLISILAFAARSSRVSGGST